MRDGFKAHHHAAIIATVSLLSTEDANMIASYLTSWFRGWKPWAELGLGLMVGLAGHP